MINTVSFFPIIDLMGYQKLIIESNHITRENKLVPVVDNASEPLLSVNGINYVKKKSS